ncbi:hypothetical protein F5Y19DRAFT_437447 [Xylariaceae sp. FL1651]|nr:hypothetical protein F5Y19DRAFT_437447 [Xylariaceae sp. FL1651]
MHGIFKGSPFIFASFSLCLIFSWFKNVTTQSLTNMSVVERHSFAFETSHTNCNSRIGLEPTARIRARLTRLRWLLEKLVELE